MRAAVLFAFFCAGIVAGLLLCDTKNVGDRAMYAGGGGIVGWILGAALGWLAGPFLHARRVKAEAHGWKHPRVVALVAQGWRVGTPGGEAETIAPPM